MKKPVLFWLYPHLSFWNGGSRYVFEVARLLVKQYEVHLIVSKGDKRIVEQFEKENVVVHGMSNKSTNDSMYWLLFPMYVFRELAKLRTLIQRYKPKAIVSSLFPTNVWAAFSKTPHIQICWEPFAFFYDRDLMRSLPFWKATVAHILALLYSWLDHWALKSADSVLTLNKATGQWVKKIYGRKVDGYTYMGVDFAHFKPVKRLQIPEKKLQRPMLFHSTDFTALKGTKELLQALVIIKKTVPEVLLLISSPHADYGGKQSLVRFIRQNNLKKNVKLLGTVSYQLLPHYYSLVDVVVFTGIGDSGAGAAASLSVLEALACGTPVVRSNYTKEEVINNKTGFLVNPHNTEQLAKACVTVLTNKKRHKTMAHNARKSILNQYQWKHSAKVVEQHLHA